MSDSWGRRLAAAPTGPVWQGHRRHAAARGVDASARRIGWDEVSPWPTSPRLHVRALAPAGRNRLRGNHLRSVPPPMNLVGGGGGRHRPAGAVGSFTLNPVMGPALLPVPLPEVETARVWEPA